MKYEVNLCVDLGSVHVTVEVDAKNKEEALSKAKDMIEDCGGSLSDIECRFGEVDSPAIDAIGYGQEADDCVREVTAQV